jgi:hypothetical protein
MAFLVPTTAVCAACKATSPAELTIEPAGSSGTLHGLGASYGDSVVPTQHGDQVGGMVATGWRFPSGERADPPPRPMEAGLQAELVPTHEAYAALQVERRWHWVNLIGKSVLVCSVACAQALRDQARAVASAHEVVTRKPTDEHVFGPLLPEIERIRGLADAALPPSPPGDVVINLESDIENGSSGWRYNRYWRGWAQTTDNIAARDLTTFGGNNNAVNAHGHPSAWSTIASLIRRWDTAGRPPAHLRRTPLPEGIERIVLALKDLALRTVGTRRGRELEDSGIAPPGADGTSFLYQIAGRDSWAEIVDFVLPDTSNELREEVAFRVDTAYRNEATFGGATPAVMALRIRVASGDMTAEHLVMATLELLQQRERTDLFAAFCDVAIAAATKPARWLDTRWIPKPVDHWRGFLSPDDRWRWRFEGVCQGAPHALVLAAANLLSVRTESLLFGTAYKLIERLRQAIADGSDFAACLAQLVEAFWHGDELALDDIPACLMLEHRRFGSLAALLLPEASAALRAEVARALADGEADSEQETLWFGPAVSQVLGLRHGVSAGILLPAEAVGTLTWGADLVKRLGAEASAFEILAAGNLAEFVDLALPSASARFKDEVIAQLLAVSSTPEKK